MHFIVVSINAQTNNLTGSPYSLFGLGVESNANTGINSGMGQLGIALEGATQINLYNPASFTSIDKHRTIFDIGFLGESQTINSNGNEEKRIAANFSNITFGFNGNGKYGVGVSLRPVTSVGYTLIGLESTIEGSTEKFITNISGSGGLNEFRLDYGRRITNNLSTGIKLSYLFGSIDETESIVAQNNVVTNNHVNYYKGASLSVGLQYKLKNKYNFGFVLDMPTNLNGMQDTYSTKTSSDAITVLEETTDNNIDDFKLPLKLGLGLSIRHKNLLLSTDFTSRFWENTNKSDGVGSFINQHNIAFGAEYVIGPRSSNYWKRAKLRIGINYDSGYLQIDDYIVDSFSASLGLGLPLKKRQGSSLNISYNYANTGTNESFLIQERTGTLNVNLTLSNIWFKRKLID